MNHWLVYEDYHFYKPTSRRYYDYELRTWVRLRESTIPWLWYVDVEGVGIDFVTTDACRRRYKGFWHNPITEINPQRTYFDTGYVWAPYIPIDKTK